MIKFKYKKDKMSLAEKIEQAEQTNMLIDIFWLAFTCVVLYSIFLYE